MSAEAGRAGPTAPFHPRRRGLGARILDALNEAGFRVVWLLGFVFLRLFYRLRVENAPRLRGPYLLASNHASFIDPVVLQSAILRRIHYLMTDVYWRSPAVNWWYRFCRTIPVRLGGGSNRATFLAAARALRGGKVLAIFPEGTRSRDGRLQRGRPGVAMIAALARVPIVPVALVGTARALPVGARFLRPSRLRVRFGEPLRFERRPGVPRRILYGEATEAIMASLARLLEAPPATP